MLAVITQPLDPVLQLGPVPIHWYGLGYAIAFLVGFRLVVPYMTKRGVSDKDANNLVWWCIVMGIIGGRLYFVLQQPNIADYLRNPVRVIAVWEGGMAFFGSLIAVLVTVMVFAYVKRLSVWVLLDAAVLFGTLPHAIGRLGNIINGDILGPPSDLPWAVRYTSPQTFAPQVGVAYQPAGAYEMLISLGIFALILFVISRRPRPGTAALVWGIAYSVAQFGIFFVRATEPVVAFGLKQAQVTALVVLLVLVPVVALVRARYPDIWANRDIARDDDVAPLTPQAQKEAG
ncbi:MAG TPA: prolipoprotein diacylglyceryl transferase [Candidatus Dormibacteraeota bacterium]|nr:prolipoprotein diacylglyceryl transferase [Candidatus Dormibacteraeota bacterium]